MESFALKGFLVQVVLLTYIYNVLVPTVSRKIREDPDEIVPEEALSSGLFGDPLPQPTPQFIKTQLIQQCQSMCQCLLSAGWYETCATCHDGCFLDFRRCFKCPDNCSTCSSTSNCKQCQPGFYGTTCEYLCSTCKNGNCNKTSCVQGCADGYYLTQGVCQRCDTDCKTCNTSSFCTSCTPVSYGHRCQYGCPKTCTGCIYYGNCTGCTLGNYGRYCQRTCTYCKNSACEKDGGCIYGCVDGYYQPQGETYCLPCPSQCARCNSDKECTVCKSGYDGPSCGSSCDQNCKYNTCNYINETCISCKAGYYGQNCEYDCNTQCQEVDGVRQCDKTIGDCTHGCENGYTGSKCTDRCSLNCFSCDQHDQRSCDTCNPGYYGQACDNNCSSHCGMVNNTRPCNKDTGKCLVNCTQGYRGLKCDVPCEASCQDLDQSVEDASHGTTAAIIGGATGFVLCLVICVILIIVCRKRRNTSNTGQTDDTSDKVHSELDHADEDHTTDCMALHALVDQPQE